MVSDVMKYAFVLGRNPDISIAELGAVLGAANIEIPKNRAVAYFEDVTLSLSKDVGVAPSLLNRLGGCTEIIEIVKNGISVGILQTEIEKILNVIASEQARAKQSTQQTGKCAFAINLLPEKKNSNVLRNLLPKVKRALREKGIRANFMNKDFQNVSAVLAVKQKLVEHGTNINIIDDGEGKVSIGLSVAMQDFEAYSKRDYGKPCRDAHVGMLPPKLAQIMVNLICHCEHCVIASEREPHRVMLSLSKHDPNKQSPLVLDPFCGTGTILMEAMLMGYSVIGSDADSRMAKAAEKNIEWLRQNFKIADGVTSEISQKDACHCERPQGTKQSLSIATEPHLGPPLSSFPAQSFLDKLIKDLSALYLGFFKNLATWLPKGTPVVFIFPVWTKNPNEKIRLSDHLIEKIEALGYSKTAFDPLQKTSLFYDRPGQTVGREIVRFMKK